MKFWLKKHADDIFILDNETIHHQEAQLEHLIVLEEILEKKS